MAAQAEAAESREAKVMRRLASALDDYGLSTIGKSVAMAYLRKLPEDDMARVRAWWLRKLNGSDLVPPSKTPARQRGCPELFEGLRAQPVWWRGCEETPPRWPSKRSAERDSGGESDGSGGDSSDAAPPRDGGGSSSDSDAEARRNRHGERCGWGGGSAIRCRR